MKAAKIKKSFQSKLSIHFQTASKRLYFILSKLDNDSFWFSVFVKLNMYEVTFLEAASHSAARDWDLSTIKNPQAVKNYLFMQRFILNTKSQGSKPLRYYMDYFPVASQYCTLEFRHSSWQNCRFTCWLSVCTLCQWNVWAL